jgi:hypothetical protein
MRPLYHTSRMRMYAQATEDMVEKMPFLMLGLDLPPAPLYKDSMEKNIIPQVQLYLILQKYDNELVRCAPAADCAATALGSRGGEDERTAGFTKRARYCFHRTASEWSRVMGSTKVLPSEARRPSQRGR